MRAILHALPSAIRGRWYGFRLDATQHLKRWMLRLGIVLPPLRVLLDVTDRCDCRCPTCDKWTSPRSPDELNLAGWKRILDKIKSVSVLGEVAISGGEPFAHPHIFDILEYAKRARLRVVIVSNGGPLNEPDFKRLHAIGVDRLMLSLNSLRASVHDASRGKPGSHAHLLALIDSWRRSSERIDLSLTAVIMESNCDELSALARFAAQEGLSGIMFQALLPTETHFAFSSGRQGIRHDRRWTETNPRWVRRLGTLAAEIDALLALQKQGMAIHNPPSQLKRFIEYFGNPAGIASLPCVGTRNRLFIDPTGNARLCYGFPSLGNLLTDDPYRLWRSSQAKSIRRESRTCDEPCRLQNCNI